MDQRRMSEAVQALLQASAQRTLAQIQEAYDAIYGTHAGRPRDVVQAALEDSFRVRGLDPAAAASFAEAIEEGHPLRLAATLK